MYELRQNIATKEWVIIAPVRSQRPKQLTQPTHPLTSERPAWEAACPFCPGNEEPELELMRIPDKGPWQVRVVKNKFPVLQPEGERMSAQDGLHRRVSGVGHHEVLIESPLHNTCPALESPDQVSRILEVFRWRAQVISEDPRMEHIIFFKNHGPRAGTTLAHPHAQIVGLPIVPYDIRARNYEARRFFDDTGACVYCQMWADALQDDSRVVIESEFFVTFVPYAACSPFHMWILPRRHESSFMNAIDQELADLGRVLRQVLRKLYVGLHDPDYNLIIRSAPILEVGQKHLHWYIALVPRTSLATGFELGSGVFINTVQPSESAAYLRSVDANE